MSTLHINHNVRIAFTDTCLADIDANEDRLKEYVEKNVGIITAVNPHVFDGMADVPNIPLKIQNEVMVDE